MTAYHLGLIGYPLGHSLSPKIHSAALRACGLDGDYSLFPIPPDNIASLQALLARVRAGDIHGLNVTIPHKQNVIPLLDELTPTAKAIGAVNTILLRNSHLIGDNTDALGFLSDLNRFLSLNPTPLPTGEGQGVREALILGAGGSARAVVHALVHTGWHITLAARRLEQAQELAAQYLSHVTSILLSELPLFPLSSLSLLVNATPLGMSPDVDASPWPGELPLPPQAAVYDLVYNPRETLLVKQAKAAGLPATTGLGMLVEQAALAFEIWTGHTLAHEILFQSVKN
jgi:shikimate dehydrogenase